MRRNADTGTGAGVHGARERNAWRKNLCRYDMTKQGANHDFRKNRK
jgi:hypothetical protein